MIKRNHFLVFSLAIMVLILPVSLYSHHGWSYYRDNIEENMKIIDLRLRNPHDQLLAEDKSGKEWNLLLAPPSRNRRFGFDGSVIEVGDELRVVGEKHISKFEIKVHCLFKGDEKIYTYRYPGGRTSYEFMRNKPNC